MPYIRNSISLMMVATVALPVAVLLTPSAVRTAPTAGLVVEGDMTSLSE